MKSFNFFRPDLDIKVYSELCGILFTIGDQDGTVESLLNKSGYKYNKDQIESLSKVLDANFMQDQEDWGYVNVDDVFQP